MIDRTRAISAGLSLAFHGVLLAAGWMTLGRMTAPGIIIQGGTGADEGGGQFSFLPTSDDQTIPNPAEWPAAIESGAAPEPFEQSLSPQAMPSADQLPADESQMAGSEVRPPDTEGVAGDMPFGIGSSIGTPSPQVLATLVHGSAPIMAGIPTSGSGRGLEPGSGDGDGIIAGPPVPSSRNRPPKYPEEARLKGLEGTVILHLHIARDGKVIQVSLIGSCGHDLLDRSAIEAVKQWIFNPATIDGKPTEWEGEQSVQFVLRG